VPEGLGSPWHVHPEEDEWFYVLEGALTFWVGDNCLSLKAGSFAFGPKGVPHTFYAEAGGARALVGFAPMQFEGFQREVGEPALERVLPPPPRATRTWHDSPPSPSETGSKSLAPLARLPATNEAVWTSGAPARGDGRAHGHTHETASTARPVAGARVARVAVAPEDSGCSGR
jgi:hypothetical protein